MGSQQSIKLSSSSMSAREKRSKKGYRIVSSRNTIIEFPSYPAAVDCRCSAKYQAARPRRLAASATDI
jgi:uncharacterized protein (DUF1330 family)